MRNLIIVLLLNSVVCLPAFSRNEDPFAPLVTRSESEVIQQAQSLADREEAVALLREAATATASAALDFTLGNLYFQLERYAEAAAAYEKALEKYPAFRNAKINLGRVYFQLEKIEEAVGLYQGLVRDGVADGETYLWLGHGLMQLGESVPAETAYRQSLLLGERRVEAKQGLLNCLIAQQREREALGLLRELLAGDVNRQAYWGARVNAYLSLEDAAAALESLETARRLGSADAEMLALLGELYLMRGMEVEAVANFQAALSAGGLSVLRREQMVAGLMHAGELAAAGELLDAIGSELKNLPSDERRQAEGRVLKLRTRLLIARGEAEAAEKLLGEVLASDPLNGEMLGMLGELQRERGDWEAAMLTRERQLRVQGFEAEALLGMGLIQAGRGEWALAVGYLERAQVFKEKPQVAKYLQQLRRMVDN